MISYNNISAYTKVYLGSTEMSKVYVSTYQVFPNGTPPTPYHFKAQYTNIDSTTGEVACNSSSSLSYTDFPSTSNILHITVGECVDSFDTHLVSSMYASLRTIDITHSNITTVPQDFMKGVSTLRNAYLNESTTTISQTAFSGCTSLSAITIPSSVTSINGSAFKNCGLREITYYSGITYETFVYSHCYSASALTIEQGTTRIEQGTFVGCSGLTSLTIPSSVTYIGAQTFSNCSGLTSITVESTTPPIIGNGIFDFTNNCPIYVPCGSLEDYKTEWSAYANRIQCIYSDNVIAYTATSKLDETTNPYSGGVHTNSFSGTGGQQLTMVSHTFEDGVGIVRFNGDIAKIGDYAFYECRSLTGIIMPSTVTSIGVAAFEYCNSLTSIDIPDSVTIIDRHAFADCTGLTSITIPDSVTSIEPNAFQYCYSLSSCTIGNGVTSIKSAAFTNCPNLTTCTIGSGITSIGHSAFANCYSLSSIVIPDSVTSISDSVFSNCSGLTSITVEATTPPTLGTYAFRETNNCPIYVPCGSIEDYKAASGWSSYSNRIQCIPSYDTQYLTMNVLGNGVFYTNRDNLSYSLDGGNTWSAMTNGTDYPITANNKVYLKGNLVQDGSETTPVIGCTGDFELEGNVMSLIFGDNFIGQTSLSGKDYAFSHLVGSNHLKNVSNLVLPATTLSNYCYSYMFGQCGNITEAPQLPATILANYCYSYMFHNCTSLTTAPELPATTLVNSCYSYMFHNCTSLTTAPELLAETSANNCYASMFAYCTSLNYIKCLLKDAIINSFGLVGWVTDVSLNGTFVKAQGAQWNTATSANQYQGIPLGWTIEEY